MKSILLHDTEVYGILHNGVRRVRRPINLMEFKPSTTPGYTYTFRGKHGLWNDFSEFDLVTSDYCPYVYGAAYTVKEAWATSQCADITTPKWPYQGYPIWYKADYAIRYTGATEGGPAFMSPGKWYSGYGMPAHVARFALRVTGVHVQPLEAASEEDARAEGHDTARPWINPKHKEPDDREDPRVVGYSSGSFAKQNMRAVYDAYYGAVAKPWCWLVDVEPVMLYPVPHDAAFRAGVKWAKASARIVQSGDVPEPLGEIRGMPPSTWYDIDWSLTDTALK